MNLITVSRSGAPRSKVNEDWPEPFAHPTRKAKRIPFALKIPASVFATVESGLRDPSPRRYATEGPSFRDRAKMSPRRRPGRQLRRGPRANERQRFGRKNEKNKLIKMVRLTRVPHARSAGGNEISSGRKYEWIENGGGIKRDGVVARYIVLMTGRDEG